MSRRPVFVAVLFTVLLLLHAIPWWALVLAPQWPPAVTIFGTAMVLIALVTLPLAMIAGHGRRHLDGWAVAGDTWLGVVWQLFAWTVIGEIVGLAAILAGVPSPERTRVIAIGVLGVVAALCGWGLYQARRVPRIRRTDVTLDRLGPGLDGIRVVLIADTHYGPIDRARWSRKLADAVNRLEPDILAHAGDLADGSVEQRREQVAPLGAATGSMARVYITGNHEYFSGALEWIEHMSALGWTVLHNRHLVIERGGAALAIAGIDDLTAAGSGVPGHHADLPAALAGLDPAVPVVLLAHQPKQVSGSAAAGVDLQLSGHTHGGQIWPFHLLVRAEQGALHGLSRHSERTQLYTTRGSGFWGPPFRVFAPSEISVLTLRAGRTDGSSDRPAQDESDASGLPNPAEIVERATHLG